MKSALLLFILAVPCLGLDLEEYYLRIENADLADIDRLTRVTSVDRVDWESGTVHAYVNSSDKIRMLREEGFNVSVIPTALDLNPGLRAGYHTFFELTQELNNVTSAYPDLCQLHNIGNTHQGKALWFMKISDNVSVEEDEPEFKYISTMHGDEVVGMELCLELIHLLTDQYGIDPQITNLVNNVEIWIMPLMNPDGYTLGMRSNAQGTDLNRDFPDRVKDPNNTWVGRAKETEHVMKWGFTHSPVLSANFHGGALVVNYPFDSDPNPYANYSATPDDALIIEQSLTYSKLNFPMYNSSSFYQGITNGIAWYLIYGGMQDWNYVWMSCNDVTIELGSKWPPYSQIPGYWNDNRASMLAYMEKCLEGVRGVVTNSVTGDPLNATVRAVGIDHDVFTDPDVGDYHRMLLPGTYTIRVSAEGFHQKDITGVVVGSGDATRLDVTLDPKFPLVANAGTLSAALGGKVAFTLMAGAGNGNRNYLMLGSATGTSPGHPLPGGLATLPLNWDAFTSLVLSLVNSPLFSGFMGSLDASGCAAAQLNAPPLPASAVGVHLDFAFTCNNPFDYASNAKGIDITP
jgi:carboxypeptidase D